VRADGETSPGYLGVEVVAYESETWARRALAEWRDAIGECELGKDVDVLGVSVRYYSATQRRNGRLPVADNAVGTSVTGAEATGVKQTAYQILQRRGRRAADRPGVRRAQGPRPRTRRRRSGWRRSSATGWPKLRA
jgi:hypothetical protein